MYLLEIIIVFEFVTQHVLPFSTIDTWLKHSHHNNQIPPWELKQAVKWEMCMVK